MPAIFFALISFLGWGIGDIFGTIATRKIGAFSTTLYSYILRVAIFALYIPFALAELSHLTKDIFLINIILGVLLLIGFLAFNEALRTASAPLVGTIAASFVVVVVILSIIFLKESITARQLIAILIIFAGLVLSTLDLRKLKAGKFLASRGIFLAVVAMMTWGIYFTFIKIPVREIGWFWPNYISFTLFPLVLVFTHVRKIKLNAPNYKGAFIPLCGTVLLTGIAEFSFNSAISRGLTAIVAPIAGSYPTLFAVLAFLVFRDPITRQQIIGIIVTLIGIVFLSIYSI